jgi:hypothetical protein
MLRKPTLTEYSFISYTRRMKKLTGERMNEVVGLRLPVNEHAMLERCGVVSDADRSKVMRHCIEGHFVECVMTNRPLVANFDDKATSPRKTWTFRVSSSQRRQLRECVRHAEWTQTKMIRYLLRKYFHEHGRN